MFSVGSYQSTYTGPFEASGELLRRGRRTAMEAGAAAGQQRAYFAPGRGVGAGSGAMRYRAGMEADRNAAQQYGAAQESLLGNLMADADARFTYQTNQSDELNLLRNLQMQRDTVNQNFNLTKRGDTLDNDLFRRRLRAEREAGNRQAIGSMFSSMLGVA